MSSDVYIDFNEDAPNEDLGNWIGHLGVMSYYGMNLLDRLRDICYEHKGIVTEQAVQEAMSACQEFQNWCEAVDSGTISANSCYHWQPGRWRNESPSKENIEDLLSANLGSTWSVRVD